MYNLHKIILLYINEMFKLNINNSKPKDWPQIPLIIHNQMCYFEYMILMWGKTYQYQISNAGGWFIGVRFSKFHDFRWFFKVPWLSMTFPENFSFPGFPDPVGTLNDVIMSAMAFQITGVSIVYSTVGSGADQRKHQSSASLAFVRGIHRWPVNSPHKRPVTRKMFPFDDVIMDSRTHGSVTRPKALKE